MFFTPCLTDPTGCIRVHQALWCTPLIFQLNFPTQVDIMQPFFFLVDLKKKFHPAESLQSLWHPSATGCTQWLTGCTPPVYLTARVTPTRFFFFLPMGCTLADILPNGVHPGGNLDGFKKEIIKQSWDVNIFLFIFTFYYSSHYLYVRSPLEAIHSIHYTVLITRNYTLYSRE